MRKKMLFSAIYYHQGLAGKKLNSETAIVTTCCPERS